MTQPWNIPEVCLFKVTLNANQVPPPPTRKESNQPRAAVNFQSSTSRGAECQHLLRHYVFPFVGSHLGTTGTPPWYHLKPYLKPWIHIQTKALVCCNSDYQQNHIHFFRQVDQIDRYYHTEYPIIFLQSITGLDLSAADNFGKTRTQTIFSPTSKFVKSRWCFGTTRPTSYYIGIFAFYVFCAKLFNLAYICFRIFALQWKSDQRKKLFQAQTRNTWTIPWGQQSDQQWIVRRALLSTFSILPIIIELQAYSVKTMALLLLPPRLPL